MSSFVKSLPSQRKKVKERKSRHQKWRSSCSSTQNASLDGRSHAADAMRRGTDERSRGTSLQPQVHSQGSIVEATEVQYPPPAMMGLAFGRKSIGNAKESVDDDATEAEKGGSSQETTLSQSQGTIVEATEVQYPPSMMAPSASKRVNRGVQMTKSSSDLRVSPVHSSFAVAISRVDFDRAYDEETVGMMNYPLSEREEIHGLKGNNRPGDETLNSEEATKSPFSGRNENFLGQGKSDKSHGIMGREGSHFTEQNLSLETEPRGTMRGSSHFTERNISSNSDPVTKPDEDAGEEKIDDCLGNAHKLSRGTNHTVTGHDMEGRLPDSEHSHRGAQKHDKNMELMLSTSDIVECIEGIAVAKKIVEADQSEDPFHDIDIERWQSVLKDFAKYIAAVGDPSSTEAEELQKINSCHKVYAIFDRGMDVNDCNALFIYNMIHTLSDGIYAHDKSHLQCGQNLPSHQKAYCKKLNHLAACLDMIFGVSRVSEDSDPLTTTVSMSVSKEEKENLTVLKFSKTLELSNQNDELSSSIIQQPVPPTMPPHLQAMSQVFARFATENTRPLQLQLDSTRKTLAVTREGAMDLQRQALKLQDALQDARTIVQELKASQERAEAELGRQKYEFERREESFERVKEHYKAEIDRKELELANSKESNVRELMEAKAELARVKHSYIEERGTEQRKRKENDGRRDGQHIKHEHHKRRSTHPEPNANLPEETTNHDHISSSIPRKIEYHAVDTFGGDVEKSRKRSKVSGRQSRHSIGSVTSRKTYPSAPYALQPPRKPRASSEPKARGKNHKTDQRRGSTSRSGVQVGEHNGHSRQLGGTNRRNPLKSANRNSLVDNEKKEPKNIRERSSRKDQQPHDGRIEREEGNQISNFASSPRIRKVTKNPYLKQSKLANKAGNETDSNGEPLFAYQEVVRGRDKRQALPGHDCEECRKFHEALGKGYDTGEMIMECSRHRARHAPPSTPPNFWKLTFVDSVGSKESIGSQTP